MISDLFLYEVSVGFFEDAEKAQPFRNRFQPICPNTNSIRLYLSVNR